MNNEENIEWIYERMLESVKILSADANKQIEELAGWDIEDELALSFYNDVVLMSDTLLSSGKIDGEIYKKIMEINSYLDDMSKEKELWTDEQLKDSPKWMMCRAKSRELLTMLN
ncbi:MULTISPECIES: hypothetical protein [unclassified Clostridium]|uniref:hypothetical protein n=1 Tax=unclassified Clostridium TaxID=2614128 RepID=UPI002A81215E|nr:hypothetical protein [Clostridium sp.]MDY4251877.1 hypothetical protein [Clostridium sp.]MDY6226833.1 hypothetical protein [Clostridium sp.]